MTAQPGVVADGSVCHGLCRAQPAPSRPRLNATFGVKGMKSNKPIRWLSLTASMGLTIAWAYTAMQLRLPNHIEYCIDGALFMVGFGALYFCVLLPTAITTAFIAWRDCATRLEKIFIVTSSLAVLLLTVLIPDAILRHRG